MMRAIAVFCSLLRWNFKIHVRYFVWLVAAIITGVWWLLLMTLSENALALWVPALIFADIGTIGLILVAGLLFLEKGEGTNFVAMVMPVSDSAWIATKLVSLTVLCTLCGIVLITIYLDVNNWLAVILAVTLNSALFCSIGFALACPFNNLFRYFLTMALALMVLNLPLLDYLGVFSHPLLWLIPSHSALMLLALGTQPEVSLAFYWIAGLVLAWIMLLHWSGTRLYQWSLTRR